MDTLITSFDVSITIISYSLIIINQTIHFDTRALNSVLDIFNEYKEYEYKVIISI